MNYFEITNRGRGTRCDITDRHQVGVNHLKAIRFYTYHQV